MYKQKSKEGISLIVLLIVIMVMIILASAIILLVNDRDIIISSTDAVKASNSAKAKEIVLVAKAEWRTNKKQITEQGFYTFKNYAESRLVERGFSVGKNAGDFEVSPGGLFYEYKYPIVPNGFVASDLSSEDEISEGFVIYEGKEKVSTDEDALITRNQFVWIPVPNCDEFMLKEGYRRGVLQNHIYLGEVSEPCVRSILELTSDTIQTDEYSEYNAIRASVEKYGGFYIARYEAGTLAQRTDAETDNEVANDVIFQKNKYPYNYVSWGTSMTETGTSGAVSKSRNLYLNSDVISHLVYGAEWDSVIRYINNNGFNRDSSIYGNYTNYNENVETKEAVDGAGSLKLTGSSENWKIKNVYDLAGNVAEWTMEAFHGPIIGRVVRGGAANQSGYEAPVSNRKAQHTNDSEELLGFRVALCLK